MHILLLAMMLCQENKSVFIDRVAIKVNDKIITERELLFTYKQRREQAMASASGAELDRLLKDAWKTTVEEAEKTLLMYEKAVEIGYAFSRDDVMGELMGIKESRGLSDEEFEVAIEEQTGMTLTELVDLRQRENSAQMVFRSQVLQKISIEDNEVAKYYAGHQDKYMNPATYQIAEIVFLKNSDGASARSRAEKCKADLASGMDFAEAASTYSDSLSKEKGGDLGVVKFGDLLPVIEDQVRAMSVGDYSELLETDSALFIIKLLAFNKTSPKPVEEVRDQILDALRQPRTEAQMDKFIAQLRSEYSVKTYLEDIPWYLEY